jgi:hypothetical protein
MPQLKVWGVFLLLLFEKEPHYVAQAGLELVILLRQPPE